MIDWDKPIFTRDGRNARVIDDGMSGKKPFAVAIQNEDVEYVILYHRDGRTHIQYHMKVRTDLTNMSQQRWVNCYRNCVTGPYYSRESADDVAGEDRITCIPFTEGDGLDGEPK